jgi:transglutaminase-like putative cysteine protease
MAPMIQFRISVSWLAVLASFAMRPLIANDAEPVLNPTVKSSQLAERNVRIDYGGSLQEVPKGARVRVWLPVPQTTKHQQVTTLESTLPNKGRIATEKTYGNKILYFDTVAPACGDISFNTAYAIRRQEVRGLSGKGRTELSPEQRKLFLSANRNVPVKGEQLDSLAGSANSGETGLSLARSLYYRVDEHVRYDKSKPGYGNGDVLWVCDSRFGNCTDFHSLFISLSRAKGVPARFEIGLPLPPKRGQGTIGGYHCWALFHVEEKGWVPVDISEADKHPELKQYYFGNLTENRVTLTTGRDIQLVPKQDGAPLNYFVYPHVEVNGKVWPKDKMTKQFTFKDVK